MTTDVSALASEGEIPARGHVTATQLIDEWRLAIDAMDAALGDLGAAKEAIETVTPAMAREEAILTLNCDGKNAEHRKAQLTLAMAASSTYVANLTNLTRAQVDLADAERRVLIARERCRLLQACVAITRGAGLDVVSSFINEN